MDYVLIAPFGFAVAGVTVLFSCFWRYAQIAVGIDARSRRLPPSSH
jgi:hypothetical protein